MKSTSALVLVLLALAVGAIAAALVFAPTPPWRTQPDAEGAGNPLALDPDVADAAAAIEIITDAATLRLERGEAGWTIVNAAGFPADPASVTRTLLDLTRLVVTAEKTALPTRHADLGLQAPEPPTGAGDDQPPPDPVGPSAPALLRLLSPAGEAAYEIILGDGGSRGASRFQYARRPGEDQTYEVAGRIDLSTEPTDWIPSPLLEITREQVERVTVTRPGDAPYTIERDGDTGRNWRIADMPAGMRVESPFRLGAAAGALAFFRPESIRRADRSLSPDDQGTVATALFTLRGGGTVLLTLAPPADDPDADPPHGRWAQILYEPSETGGLDAESEPPADDELAGQIRIPPYIGDYAFELALTTYDNLTRPLGEILVEDEASQDAGANAAQPAGPALPDPPDPPGGVPPALAPPADD